MQPLAGNEDHAAARSLFPLCPQWDGEEKWTKGETRGLRYRECNKTIKEIIITTIIIKNKQIVLYTVQFFSPLNN